MGSGHWRLRGEIGRMEDVPVIWKTIVLYNLAVNPSDALSKIRKNVMAMVLVVT